VLLYLGLAGKSNTYLKRCLRIFEYGVESLGDTPTLERLL